MVGQTSYLAFSSLKYQYNLGNGPSTHSDTPSLLLKCATTPKEAASVVCTFQFSPLPATRTGRNEYQGSDSGSG